MNIYFNYLHYPPKLYGFFILNKNDKSYSSFKINLCCHSVCYSVVIYTTFYRHDLKSLKTFDTVIFLSEATV